MISSKWLGNLVTKTFNLISSPGGTTWKREPLIDGGDGDEEVLETESKTPCIFCAADCPSTFSVKNGKVVKLTEGEVEGGGDVQNNDKILKGKRLLSMYIVRNILKVSKGTCAKLLSNFGGECHPELWVTLCSSCKKVVNECGKTELEIKRLEAKVKVMKERLKGLVRESSERGTENEAAGEEGPLTVWKQIRNDANRGIPNMEETDDEDDDDEELKNLKEIVFSVRPKFKRSSNGQTQDTKRQDVKKMRLEFGPDLTPVKKKVNETLTPSQKPRIYYKCDQCSALIQGTKSKIQAHKELHQPNGKGKKCKKCGWLVRYMKAHLKAHHSKKKPNLSSSNKIIKPISLWGKVDASILRYTDVSNENWVGGRQFGRSIFKCRHCPGSFNKKNYIEEHSRLHDEGRGVICGSCGWLIAEDKMGRHMAKRHNRNSASFIGPVLSTGTKPSLSENNQEHQEELLSSVRVDKVKPFTCDQCDISFYKKSGLQTHKLSKIHNLNKDKAKENGSEATTEDLDNRNGEQDSRSIREETPRRLRVSKRTSLDAKFGNC